MSSHFVVIVQSSLTERQVNAVTNKLKRLKLSWFHWFDRAWLVKDATEEWTAKTLRNALRDAAVYPRKPQVLVLEVEPLDWASYCPTDWTDWLKRNWSGR